MCNVPGCAGRRYNPETNSHQGLSSTVFRSVFPYRIDRSLLAIRGDFASRHDGKVRNTEVLWVEDFLIKPYSSQAARSPVLHAWTLPGHAVSLCGCTIPTLSTVGIFSQWSGNKRLPQLSSGGSLPDGGWMARPKYILHA